MVPLKFLGSHNVSVQVTEQLVSILNRRNIVGD